VRKKQQQNISFDKPSV